MFNGEGMWQTLVRNKYLSSKSLSQVEIKQGDSHFWRGLMKIRNEVLANGSFQIKDGTQTRFWEDTWASNQPFKDIYPTIYNIAHHPHDTVAKVMNSTSLNISFRRALVDEKLDEWLRLVAQVSNFNLTQGRDTFSWHLTKSGQFTVRSMYLHLANHNFPFRHKFIWKLKVPLKIKIFLWYLQKGVLLTKDNLRRKNWKSS